jgi:hypothetical protein
VNAKFFNAQLHNNNNNKNNNNNNNVEIILFTPSYNTNRAREEKHENYVGDGPDRRRGGDREEDHEQNERKEK